MQKKWIILKLDVFFAPKTQYKYISLEVNEQLSNEHAIKNLKNIAVKFFIKFNGYAAAINLAYCISEI